jgi:hypothetical protein
VIGHETGDRMRQGRMVARRNEQDVAVLFEHLRDRADRGEARLGGPPSRLAALGKACAGLVSCSVGRWLW